MTRWHVILVLGLALEATLAFAGQNTGGTSSTITQPPPRTECRKLVGQNYVPCDELAWLQADA